MPDTVPAPASRPVAPRVRSKEQATAALGRIGAAQAQLDRLKTALDVAIAGLRLGHEANRATLLSGRKKSADLATGSAGWRKTAERVVVAEGVDLLEQLEADRKFKRFIRTRSEPDLQALLKETAVAVTIPGVSIAGGEDVFFVKPLILAPV